MNKQAARKGISARPSTLKTGSRYLFGGLFILAGINHFLMPHFYARIMPPYLPRHRELILLSGAIEIALGALLLTNRYRRLAAWGIIALLLAVFPANIYMASNPQLFPTLSPTALYLRLPLQMVLIAWAYLYTRADAVK